MVETDTFTALSRFTSTCAFTNPSSIVMAPLSIQHSCTDPEPSYPFLRSPTHQLAQLETCCTHAVLTHSSLIWHIAFASPIGHISTDPLPTWYPGLDLRPLLLTGLYSLASPAWSLLENTMHTLHTPGWGRYRYPFTAASNRHSDCDPWPQSRCWCGAPHLPHSQPPCVCRPLQFLHPHSPGNSSFPLVNNLVNCKIQVDLESGMCMLIAHQPAWLGALFLVIVSIFTLSGPHLSILLIFHSTLLLIIPVWRPSLRQPCLNQHSHILFLSLSIRTTNQVYNPSLSPFLLISCSFGKGPWLDTLKEAGTVLPSLILSLFWTCGCRGVAIYDRERKRPRGHTFISEIVTWKSCRVVSSMCVPPHHTSLFKSATSAL